MIKYIKESGSMENTTKINLEKIREAIKQADANIKFEEVKDNFENKIKTLKRGNNYDRRTLG